jgi:uncharacterized protein (TIGR02466 family)
MLNNPPPRDDSRHAKMPAELKKAVLAHEAGDLDAAYPHYRAFIQENPGHPLALQLIGLLYSQRGKFDQAIEFMRESLRLFPEQAEVANNLGNALSRCGRLEEAVESFLYAIKLLPNFSDAMRNLGICQLRMNRIEEAMSNFRRCLDINPEDAVAQLGLGNCHKARNNFESAIPEYERAIAIRSDYADAHHNLGVCLRLVQRPQEALKHYQKARGLGLDRAELHHNQGNALIDLHDAPGAIDSFREAVKRNPLDLDSHRNLNSLLWQQELLDDYLKSYRDALDRHPTATDLRLAYAMALNQRQAHEDAERVLEQGLAMIASSDLMSLLAYTLEGQGRWKDALRHHAEAVNMPGSAPNHRISYARALLACKRPDEALKYAQEGAASMPFNQRALAYLGLCWRLLDDARDEMLNDYERFVRVFDIPVPSHYADAAEFNSRLAAAISPLHISRQHPAEQTLRGGTQTSGDLFLRPETEIAELVSALDSCVRQYIAELPSHSSHPLLMRRCQTIEFAASWSVRLARSGFHTMHVHPLGWISSAYYVQLPAELAQVDHFGGELTLGEPDIDVGEKGAARRVINPAVGQLVLFPSYMWHGTVPFESDEPRMTVAFDVVPGQRPSDSSSSGYGVPANE